MTVLEKVLKAPQKCWQFFAYVRNSPESIGPSLAHKVLMALVYCACFCCSVYMIISILTHQTVFKNIVENGENSTVEYPSVILCPEKSNIYQYSFIANKTAIVNLGLGVKAINILARAAKENRLHSQSTASEIAPHIGNATNMHPEEMWKSIINWVYYRSASYYYTQNVVKTGDGTWKYADIDCYYNQSTLVSCSQTLGIWLTDNSYCFFWNNTARNHTHIYPKTLRSRTIMHNKHTATYKAWVGNLLTDEIVFESGNKMYLFLSMYKIHRQTQVICQPLIENSCNTNNQSHTVDYIWKYIIGKRIPRHVPQRPYALMMDIYLPTTWYDLQSVSRFTIGKAVEVIGNILGIWVGFSILAFLKVGLIFIKKWVTLHAKAIISLQVMAVLVLLFGIAVLESWNYSYRQQHRYIAQVNIDSDGGVPYPSVHFCFLGMSGYNQSKVEKLNISLPLLTYIQATSTFVPHHFLIPSVMGPEFFVYHSQTPAEVGYHWSFMEFPLQYVSDDLYESYMTKVENEYVALSAKLGVNPLAPSFTVLSKLMLDPCKAMRTCYIDGKQDTSCCKYFKPVVHTYRQGDPVCWLFDNRAEKLKQTQPGTEHGAKFVFDVDEMSHGMPQIWLDDYLKKYAKNCSALYNNCETGIYNKSGWNPYSFISITVNEYIGSQQQVAFVQTHHNVYGHSMRVQRDIGLKATRTTYHKDKPGSKCSNHRPVSDVFYYTQQEILDKKCSCYICSDPPVYDTQVGPCCTPKDAGRCLTSSDMYSAECKYGKFAGNLPPEAPGNIMLSSAHHSIGHCKNFAVSEYNQLYQSIQQRESELKTQPCTSFLVHQTKADRKVTTDNSMILNFHYEAANYLEFMEHDLQNSWEQFGLLTGVLCLSFGLTYVATIRALITGTVKMYNIILGKTNISDSVTRLAFYGLSKFSKRLKYLIISNDTDTPPAPIAMNAVHVAPAVSDEEHSQAADKADNQPDQPLDPVQEANSGKETLSFLVVLTGLCFLIVFSFQLQKSMEIDKITHQFSLEDRDLLPNIGICTDLQQNTENKTIHNFFKKCLLYKSQVDCKDLFPLFLANRKFHCLLSIYNAATAYRKPKSSRNAVEIEF